MKTLTTFHSFLELPVEMQMAIIREIKDDRTLFRFFSANRYTWSLFKKNVDTIFELRISQLTGRDATSFLFKRAKEYLSRQKNNVFYIKEAGENHTPLSYMVFNGFEKATAVYLASLQNRVEMMHKVRHGYNFLMLAILSCNPAMVDLILAQPEADQFVGEANEYGDKPIHFAARIANRDILQSLVEHPAFLKKFINVRGNNRDSPVANFCKYHPNDDIDFLNDLIKYGAIVDQRAICYRSTTNSFLNDPIWLAITHKKPRVAMLLLSSFRKEDVNQYIKSPEVTLKAAIENGYKEIVIFLLECGVGVARVVDPEKSLLMSTIPFNDLELTTLVFNLESTLYEKVTLKLVVNKGAGELANFPVFADYLLGAMSSLLQQPITEKTWAMYHLLLEFGFDTSMSWYIQGVNIFHLISGNMLALIGKSEESILFSEKIVFDLLARDSVNGARNQADDDGVVPLRLLADGKYQSLGKTLEEGISDLFMTARNKLAEKSQVVESLEEDNVLVDEYVSTSLYAHDDGDRGYVMMNRN